MADVALVVAGSTDVGKSTTIGVLTSGVLDDGNGLARLKVSRHKHEKETGQTSDISTKLLNINDKIVTLIDLCGHEKYLKTTTFGITGHFPDYAIVIIAANRGVIKMTREHLGILFYMKIPTIILVTRVDIAPINIYKTTLTSIREICKHYNKRTVFINGPSELKLTPEETKINEEKIKLKIPELTSKMEKTSDIIPVITISNKTGYYLETVKTIIGNLNPRQLWITNDSPGSEEEKESTVFYIDSIFNPPGIGVVVSGINKGKTIKIGDTLCLGPYMGSFIPVRVRSIHNNNRENVSELNNHQRGCLAISSMDKKIELSRSSIRRGNVVITSNLKHYCHWEFSANIEVLHHSTTISENYSPVIHMGTIRQSAKLKRINNIIRKNKNEEIAKDNEKVYLKTGDIANVTFRFIQRPEFIEPDTIFFFREGTTRGIGKTS
jgi:elongation factor 1-alpha